MSALFLVGFIFLFIVFWAGVFMILGVAGAYRSSITSDKVSTAGLFGLPASNKVLAIHGVGGFVFLSAFIAAISNS